MPPVELVDAEALCVTFVRSKISVPVATKTPSPRPARFVRVWRTGGAAVNRILDRPQITVTCTASDSVTASADATALRNAFFNDYTDMGLVRRVEEVAGVYFDPDPDTGADRYTFTVVLNVRGR